MKLGVIQCIRPKESVPERPIFGGSERTAYLRGGGHRIIGFVSCGVPATGGARAWSCQAGATPSRWPRASGRHATLSMPVCEGQLAALRASWTAVAPARPYTEPRRAFSTGRYSTTVRTAAARICRVLLYNHILLNRPPLSPSARPSASPPAQRRRAPGRQRPMRVGRDGFALAPSWGACGRSSAARAPRSAISAGPALPAPALRR